MKEETGNPIVNITFHFAIGVIRFAEELEQLKKFVIGRQVLRSGTAIGALVREAQTAESRADFIHKLKIAQKEAHETEYWLLLCQHSHNYPNADVLLKDLLSIQKLLSRIISTSVKNKVQSATTKTHSDSH